MGSSLRRALAEAGIEPEIVCGCSIGALVGAAYVVGELPALKKSAQSLTWRESARMLDVRLSGGGLLAGHEIVAFLRKLKISAPIGSYSKSFAAGEVRHAMQPVSEGAPDE
jgi:NTE family protein